MTIIVDNTPLGGAISTFGDEEKQALVELPMEEKIEKDVEKKLVDTTPLGGAMSALGDEEKQDLVELSMEEKIEKDIEKKLVDNTPLRGAISAFGDEEKYDAVELSLEEKIEKDVEKKLREQEEKLETKLLFMLHSKLSVLANGANSFRLEKDATKETATLLKEQTNQLQEHMMSVNTEAKKPRSSFPGFKFRRTIVKSTAPGHESTLGLVTEDDDDCLLFNIPGDTFMLMTFYKVRSRPWILSIIAYLMQMTLVMLILIIQISLSDNSTMFNVPFKVDFTVRIGQFIVIPLALIYMDDILTAIQCMFAFWHCDHTAFQELFQDHGDPPSLPATSRDYRFYALYIFLPNLLKFSSGALVLLVKTVILVQSDDLIRMLMGYSVLFFVSEIDNVVFRVAIGGYFGKKLALQAQAIKGKAIVDRGKLSFYLRSIILFIVGSSMITILSFVAYGQVTGIFFEQKYPDCDVTDVLVAIPKMINGICDGGELNTLGCAFDGGDCINHNLAFPGCTVNDPELFLGNGVCDGGLYNTFQCKYDNGDCIIASYTDCHTDNIELFGDGVCHLELNTASCGYDNGDCDVFNKYPYCDIPDPEELGNGSCNYASPYNSILCGFDSGDCVEAVHNETCIYEQWPVFGNITEVGDGKCNANTNNRVCGWDGLDCLEFNAKYPACGVKYGDLDPERVGDGRCDNFGGYNSVECGYDGSDCDEFNLKYPECEGENPKAIGDGNCDFEYNNAACGFDGYDCLTGTVDCRTDVGSLCTTYKKKYPDCPFIDPRRIGNGVCDGGAYNVLECGMDGGDCDNYNSYPNCNVENPGRIGNGACDGGDYNVLECEMDGGDCVKYNSYPDCNVENPAWIGNGSCDGGAYNTIECGMDGGDCVAINAKYPNCNVEYPGLIGDGHCNDNWAGYNTIECEYDGGDCSP